jgi:uncharacterized protein YukE
VIAGGNPAGTAGVGGFPDPPTGSPGDIAAIARALSGAADDLEHVDGGLRGASATLATDWQGYAAAAYHGASDGLASVARGGAESFRDCARAVSGYSGALEQAQSEIHRLRVLYDAAMAAEASAGSTVSGLQNKLASATKPAQISKLNTGISSAQSDAQNAAFDASGYARRASSTLDEFKHTQARYAQVLSGARLTPGGGPAPGSPFVPFEPAGAPGPGFGVPLTAGAIFPGLLSSAYGGVIPVGNPWANPIPGYGRYEDDTTPEAVPTNDLANAVALVAAPEAAGPVEDLLGSGARTLAERLGIGTAEREAAQGAAGQAAARSGDIGAMNRLEFEASPKHPDLPAENGQGALDNSLQVSANSTRRVGVD